MWTKESSFPSGLPQESGRPDPEAGPKTRPPLDRVQTKGWEIKPEKTERTVTAALNYQTIKEKGRDVGEALNSTLCFDKGSPLIVDVKLIVVGVRVYIVIPPHCRDASVRDHSISPKAEAAPEAFASLQRRQLNDRARAQLQEQEDSSEGGDNGHAAKHSDGDGKLGSQLDIRLHFPLAHHVIARWLSHVLVDVQAGARDGVQGSVNGAGQARLRAEAAAGQAGRWAGQAG